MDEGVTVKAWFCRDVLPLEAALTRYIRSNWRNESDVADLRQEIYARAITGARNGLPLQTKAFVFTIARNHLINSARHARVISLEHVADLEGSAILAEEVTPERHLVAREELKRLQAGLERLPPRCREVIQLRRIEGLSAQEVATRLKVDRHTVNQQVVHGMRALANFLLGGDGKIRRPSAKGRQTKEIEE